MSPERYPFATTSKLEDEFDEDEDEDLEPEDPEEDFD